MLLIVVFDYRKYLMEYLPLFFVCLHEYQTETADFIKTNGSEIVSNVRVGVTVRESIRRQEENRKIDVWKKKRLDEKTISSGMNDSIRADWELVAKLNGPYELQQVMRGFKND